MSEIEILRFIFASAALIMTLEDQTLRPHLVPEGARAWSIQREDLPSGLLRASLDLIFSERGLSLQLALRAAAALGLLISPNVIDAIVLFIGQWLWAVRWRGLFNGGSDQMMMIVSAALGFYLYDPTLEKAGLTVVAAALVTSYVVAGVAKLRRAEWRNGSAVKSIAEPYNLKCRSPVFTSWLILIFELSFPLGLVSPRLAMVYVAVGLIFNAINAYALGLNRFFLAWATAYPALIAMHVSA